MSVSLDDFYRSRVFTTKGKPIGRVVHVLFSHAEPTVIGFVVQRPRLLFVFDRKDRYLARDRVRYEGGDLVILEDRDAWDKRAANRLGIEWDDTVIWSGMPVRTEGGSKLGSVKDGRFEFANGRLEQLIITGGAVADAAVGTRRLESRHVRGYREGWIVVGDQAVESETSGGAAAMAGKGAAVAKKQVSEASTAAQEAAVAAAKYGKAAAKAAAESETGKKAIGWLKSMRDEIVDAMGDPDDDD